ncbi:MAG: hypothetical protein M3326_04215 [Actinomycetota bacterium]|nr:hypothetical protein [Actinomycetota bacterium]
MNIAIVVVTYNLPNSTRWFETGQSRTHDVRFHVFQHSRRAEVVAAFETLAHSDSVVLYPYGENRGVARSLNEGILDAYSDSADVVIFANEDVEFSAGDVDRLAETAAAHRDRYVVSCAGVDRRLNRRLPSLGYACIAINPVAFDVLGCFDENFFPLYCEDDDYCYRALLAGLSEGNCSETNVLHLGSACINTDAALREQNDLTHGRNFEYYRRKWGGDSRHERFTRPFDDRRFDHKIAADARHAPYGPEFDRYDRDIVRV